MQIIVMIILLSVFIWIMPKKNVKVYLIVSVIFLSGLFLFFWPDNTYDLYRYYLMLKTYKDLSIFQALGIQANTLGNSLIELTVNGYVSFYKVYSMFAWIISKMGLYQLLGVFTCLIVYGLMAKQINGIFIKENMKIRTLKFCFVFILLTYNYILLSCVRQPIVCVVFGFVLYYDLVEKYDRKKCFIIYLLLCMVHSFGFLLVGIRLLVAVSNKAMMVCTAIAFFSIYSFIPLIAQWINIANIPIIREFLVKIIHYLVDRAVADNQHVSIKATLMYVYLFLILLYFMKYSKKKYAYRKYTYYIILLFLLSMAMTGQADVYNRMQLLFPILFIPIIMELLEEFSGKYLLSIKRKNSGIQPYLGLGLAIVGTIVIFVCFYGTCNDSYFRAQRYYTWGNFMNNVDLTLPAWWQ